MKFKWFEKDEQKELEKFQKNVKNYSNDEILDQFKTQNWEKLGEEKQVALLQEMENRKAKEQNREPAYVFSEQLDGAHRSYYDRANTMKIDVSKHSSYDILDTYEHESNHANQASKIKNDYENKGQNTYSKEELAIMKCENARDNFNSFYNANPNYYNVELSEMDSNKEAGKVLIEQKERYMDDPNYKSYIKDRNSYFKTVNKELKENNEQRKNHIENSAIKSNIRGDISEEEYYSIEEYIDNDNKTDIENDYYEVGANFEELDNELNNANSNYYNNENQNENNNQSNISYDISTSMDCNYYNNDYSM